MPGPTGYSGDQAPGTLPAGYGGDQTQKTVPDPPAIGLLVDWNLDGDWADTGEDVTAAVDALTAVTAVRGRDQLRHLAPPAAGAMQATLHNQSRTYSPANAASPLFGLLAPGPAVRWQAAYDGATYPLATGVLQDLPQHTDVGREAVDLPCLGTLSRLVGVKVSTALYQNVTTSAALGYLLDAAGWPAADRVIDTGQTTLRWWWLDDQDALDAAKELLVTEGPGAALYEDGQGRAVFESRQYRLVTARSTTVQAAWNADGSAPWHRPGITYNPGLRDVVNRCTVETKVRAAAALAAVWTLGQTATLGAGETRTYVVRSSGGDPFTAAVAPVAGTDYTVAAGSLTAATLDRTSGARAVLTLTAGGSGATVTGLQVRAQAVAVTSAVTVEDTLVAETTASRNRYGTIAYPLRPRAEIDVEVARDFCNAVVQRYRQPRALVAFTVPAVGDATTRQVLTRQVSDRVGLVDAQAGIAVALLIEQIAYRFVEWELEATIGGEQADDTSAYALWGSATWGTSRWAF